MSGRARAIAGLWIENARRIVGGVGAALADQAPRAFLWAVVAFAAGILLFFSWDKEPTFGVGTLIIAVGGGLAWLGRSVFGLSTFAAAVIVVGAGHMAAEIRTLRVATPLLSRPLYATVVHGRVVSTELHPTSARVVIDGVTIEGLAPEETPKRLRLTMPLTQGLPTVASGIVVRASLRPPMRPVLPDGFAFHRFLYFESIGGTGTVYSWAVDIFDGQESWAESFMATVDVTRRAISAKVSAAIPDRDEATVTAALIMGEQSTIPDDLQEAYRVAGLAHMLSISGVHMSLLAGVVFFFMRRVLALFPALALRFDTKKAAAGTALAILTLYLLISGMSVPAIRSYLMIGVVLIAVLMDRTAISLRTVGWAALVLMAIYPDAVVGASFQMSFMAILALVAVAEHVELRSRWISPEGKFLILPAIGVILAAAVVTDIAAGGSTAIFAVYHFNRFPTYSMVSNLIADPIVGLWIMPWGLIASLAMPFGLEAFPLRFAGDGVALVNGIARMIASWPNAQVHVPPMRAEALAVAASGLLILCLWRGRFRLIGVAFIAAGLAQPWLATPPDIVVDEDSQVVAVTDEHGYLALRPGRGDRFIREVWTERYGASKVAWPASGEEAIGLRCDSDGCMLDRNGQRVLIAFTTTALAEDCGNADATVSLKAAYAFCEGTEVVDRIDLRRRGAVAIWLTPDGIRTRFAADGMGERNWVGTARGLRRTNDQPAPADASGVSTVSVDLPDGPAP